MEKLFKTLYCRRPRAGLATYAHALMALLLLLAAMPVLADSGGSEASKHEIIVKGKSGSFTYDGTERTVSGLEQTKFIIDDITYTVSGLSAEVKRIDAGETPVEVNQGTVLWVK